MGVHLAVPVLSAAFDPACVIRLNPAASIPAVSTIWHGRAWLQETLRLCLYFSSVQAVARGRVLLRRQIHCRADTPTRLLSAHTLHQHQPTCIQCGISRRGTRSPLRPFMVTIISTCKQTGSDGEKEQDRSMCGKVIRGWSSIKKCNKSTSRKEPELQVESR